VEYRGVAASAGSVTVIVEVSGPVVEMVTGAVIGPSDVVGAIAPDLVEVHVNFLADVVSVQDHAGAVGVPENVSPVGNVIVVTGSW
jgi:hypothetical protein